MEYLDKVNFILDGNPAHEGTGIVVCVHSHAAEVRLLKKIKEYNRGSLIIICDNEVVDINEKKEFEKYWSKNKIKIDGPPIMEQAFKEIAWKSWEAAIKFAAAEN